MHVVVVIAFPVYFVCFAKSAHRFKSNTHTLIYIFFPVWMCDRKQSKLCVKWFYDFNEQKEQNWPTEAQEEPNSFISCNCIHTFHMESGKPQNKWRGKNMERRTNL